jgi:tetratricopeptide (TPR) repeat protein
VRLQLVELIAQPSRSTQDLALVGELGSGCRIELGDVSGLTMEQWLERWRRFRQRYPEFDQPSWSGALARTNSHRQSARQLFEAGRTSEAVAMWRKGLHEIDRYSASGADGRPLRAALRKEARGFLETRLADPMLGAPESHEMAGLLADLLLESREPNEWTTLVPIKLESAAGATLTRLPDHSILASGKNAEFDTYTMQARAGLKGIRALRLEVLTDPNLPQNGPGRSSNGDFCLSEISVSVATDVKAGRTQPVPFTCAAASYRRPIDKETTARDGPHGAIDGVLSTQWNIWPFSGQAHTAIFETASPVCGTDDVELIVRLDSRHQMYPHHNLGRFRLSATARPRPARDENLIVLTQSSGGWTRLGTAHLVRGDWDLALAAFRKALASPMSSAVDYLLLGLIHDHLGQPALADKDLDEAIKRMPRSEIDRLLVELAAEVIAPRIAREPKNPAWLFARFRWNAQLGLPAAAIEDLEQALTLDPTLNLTPDDLASLYELGDIAAARREWHLVAAAYRHLLHRDPDSSFIWFRGAIIQAYVGDTEEYRRACEGMLKKFGQTANPLLAERIAKVCMLVPGVITDRKKVEGLADIAANAEATGIYRSWYCSCKGLAEYRRDQLTEAVEWFDNCLAGTPVAENRAVANYIMAMARHRQGEFEAAKKLLAAAAANTPELDGRRTNMPIWHDWLVVFVIRREAEMLMKPELAPPPREEK